MDNHSYYDLQILNQLEQAPHITHRLAAEKLGVSVKLAHSIFKGLVQRGLIHVTQRDGRSLNYLLTPQGIAEKIRLTYEFMNFTTQFFREARRRSSEVCKKLAGSGVKNVAFLGCGELAEISYLGVKEHRLKLSTVFDSKKIGQLFLGLVIKDVSEIAHISQKKSPPFEKILVTTYDPSFPGKAHYIPNNITPDERFVWVFDHDDMCEEISSKAPYFDDEKDSSPF